MSQPQLGGSLVVPPLPLLSLPLLSRPLVSADVEEPDSVLDEPTEASVVEPGVDELSEVSDVDALVPVVAVVSVLLPSVVVVFSVVPTVSLVSSAGQPNAVMTKNNAVVCLNMVMVAQARRLGWRAPRE